MISLNNTQFQLSKNPYNEAGIVRGLSYFKDNPQKIIDLYKTNIFTYPLQPSISETCELGVLTAVGGLVSVTGMHAIAHSVFNLPIHPSAIVIITALFSSAVLLTVNGGNIYKIVNSDEYKAYVQSRIKFQTNEAIKKFIENDEVLKFCVCPISNQLPMIPILIDGDTYDFFHASSKKGLKEIIDRKGHTVDFIHFNTIISRFNHIIMLNKSFNEIRNGENLVFDICRELKLINENDFKLESLTEQFGINSNNLFAQGLNQSKEIYLQMRKREFSKKMERLLKDCAEKKYSKEEILYEKASLVCEFRGKIKKFTIINDEPISGFIRKILGFKPLVKVSIVEDETYKSLYDRETIISWGSDRKSVDRNINSKKIKSEITTKSEQEISTKPETIDLINHLIKKDISSNINFLDTEEDVIQEFNDMNPDKELDFKVSNRVIYMGEEFIDSDKEIEITEVKD